MKKLYKVVAGIIIHENKILCGKRGNGIFESKWEFPGGKIEANETKVEALNREIKEELGCKITKSIYFFTSEVEYEDFSIHMDTYLVDIGKQVPIPNVHQEIRWEDVNRLPRYDWCDADYKVVKELIKHRNGEMK